MRIPCPFCGDRDAAEFTYEGDATVARPALDAPAEDWLAAVYLRENPRGLHSEMWRHVLGCRAFVIVQRDTRTHEIAGSRLAHPGMAKALDA
jgi:sarcosine oxidase subunit delta